MPDFINQNESTPALREITVLITKNGAGVPGISLSGGTPATLKIGKVGGNFANSANGATLTEITGGGDIGLYALRFGLPDVDTIGDLRYEITLPGTIDTCRGIVPIVVPALTVAAILDFLTAGHTNTGSVGEALTAGGGGSITADTQAIAAAVLAGLANRTPASTPTTGLTSYDVGDAEPPLKFPIPLDGVHDTLATATSASLRWKKPDGTVTSVPLSIVDPIARVVERVWSNGDLALAGVHSGEVVITWDTGKTQTVQATYQWTVRPVLG